MSNERSPFVTIGIVAAIIVIAALTFAYYTQGVQGAFNVVYILMGLVFVGSIVAGVVALIVYLFSKKKIDMLSKRNEEIIKTCKQSKIPYDQFLFHKGDANIGTRKLGKIVGFAFGASTPEEMVKTDKHGDDYLEIVEGSEIPLIFIAYRDGFMANIGLGKPKIVCGPPDDIYGGTKALSGTRIFLNGTTFGPMIYDMFFLSHHWTDTNLIDKTAKRDVFRLNLQEYMRESKSIFDSGINLDQQFVKHKELTRMEEVPLNRG